MRSVYLKGHKNIGKRMLIHVCGLNLGILMRVKLGGGTPRTLQDWAAAFIFALHRALRAILRSMETIVGIRNLLTKISDLMTIPFPWVRVELENTAFTTDC